MIYLDCSATSLQKPPSVARAAAWAIEHLAGAGRGVSGAAMQAAREVYAARGAAAALCGVKDPLRVAFTSGATESLSLVLRALARPGRHVITTVLEHNSVLRPLYQTGCELSFLGCDGEGALLTDELPALLRANTRLMVCTAASNVLGSLTNLAAISKFCRENGLLLVIDAAQAMGCVFVDAELADFTCFTGHKALLGPQGTGGLIAGPNAPAALYKTGGTGGDSFAPHQPLCMPDMLEAGTPNAQGLYALRHGIEAVLEWGFEAAAAHAEGLVAAFLDGVSGIAGLRLYGSRAAAGRLPVLGLSLNGMDSEEAALRLWEEYGIAVRPGSHCAPLLHRRFGTQRRGMLRFSFGRYNTLDEIHAAVRALAALAGGR